ncbi:MAG: M48 family metallopeptidase [Treponemataceae bacterium]|nr:M48 family metallopeptidase [Treponemataceae bacterium]
MEKSRRRSLSIHIENDGSVVVKSPLGTPAIYIEQFVQKQTKWILKTQEKIQRQRELALSMGPLSEKDLKAVKEKARFIIPMKVEHYAQLLGVTYGKISLKLQKTRWGSCSRDGNLNFNYLLVLMPEEILDSVVVHELCHRKHMNHSKKFYEEIESVFPDYKRCDRWLKQNGASYLMRIK